MRPGREGDPLRALRRGDGGLVGMFVLYGASLDDATAAVLAYRLFQLGVPVLCGVLGLLGLTRRREIHRDPPAVTALYDDLIQKARQ